jgi:hypothetical protein
MGDIIKIIDQCPSEYFLGVKPFNKKYCAKPGLVRPERVINKPGLIFTPLRCGRGALEARLAHNQEISRFESVARYNPANKQEARYAL